MKYLLFILLVVFVSCTKSGQCYTCTFGITNGYQPPPQQYCGPMPHYFKDAQGNDLQSFCNPEK